MQPYLKLRALVAAMCLGCSGGALADAVPHNVILFDPDGLRAVIVGKDTAPAMAALRDEGVNFVNSHSLFPTFTTANASAFATGHLLGDTGDFSNVIDVGFPVKAAKGSLTPFLESDAVLQEVDADERYSGNYLNELSILAAARKAGYSTAAIGKVGPIAIQDLTSMKDGGTLIVDDGTGPNGVIAVPLDWQDAIKAAGLKGETPGRGDNGNPGTWIPNFVQQQYFMELAIKVVLPRFKAAGKPFMLVYWSRDPDGTQHNQGDSPDLLVPGINGPTSLSAIRGADSALASLRQALHGLNLDGATDIVVAADHGFSTIYKGSKTSFTVQRSPDQPPKELPVGFLAVDLAKALSEQNPDFKLFEPTPDHTVLEWKTGQHPQGGSALIGSSAAAPDVVVAANGGSDLVYLPKDNAKNMASQIVRALLEQDYVSGLFVDEERVGKIPGALGLKAIGLKGKALTPTPAIVVNFTSFSTGCAQPLRCAAEVADSGLQQGQGMHGSFSRADTWNFMAAAGPDFRKGYVDRMPASNADIGMTLAHLLGLDIQPKGGLTGRVLSESLMGGHEGKVVRRTLRSEPGANKLVTVLQQQIVGSTTYNDAAGFRGKTAGLDQK
ncbi:MAG: alkaline phosphatase family protein [Nevskia sp.]|nr:alkaline phosphatase family protein [Nevskia sp.]